MSRKQLALFEPTLVVQALKEAVKKLNPQAQWRNPVMFIVWIGSLLTTCISIAMASGAMPGNALFSAAISGWLWITVLFANFAEALAEGRSKAQANSLKGVKKTAFARKLREPKYGAAADKVPADQLRKGDIVLVEACLLYTSDAADDLLCVDLGRCRTIKKKTIALGVSTWLTTS